jgi:hypothetical protein
MNYIVHTITTRGKKAVGVPDGAIGITIKPFTLCISAGNHHRGEPPQMTTEYTIYYLMPEEKEVEKQ